MNRPAPAIQVLAVLILAAPGSRCGMDSNEPGADSAEPATSAPTAEEAERGVTRPFYSRGERDFRIAATYYVAGSEPGASNDNNGRFPTYRGGKDGPFEHLNDARIRALLSGAGGVKMVIREGVYRLERLGENESGIELRGEGDEYHPVILTGYPGETAVLDGGERLSREHIKRIREGESYSIRIRQVIQLSGRHNIVENLTVRDGFRHNVLVLGNYSVIRNNRLEGAFEDSIKTVPGADYGFIHGNDISGFASQGVDSFGASHWLVKDNEIHHPGLDPITDKVEANGIGGKGGFENVVLIRNRIHDFETNLRVGALAFGGGGSLDLYKQNWLGKLEPAATRMMAFGNVIYNFRGPAVSFHSCSGCVFSGNTVYATLGGVSLGLPPPEYEAETNRGLPRTVNAVVTHNRFAGNFAGLDVCREGAEIPPGTTCYGVFVQSPEAAKGLVFEGNQYFTDTPPRFAYRGEKVELVTAEEFETRLGLARSTELRPRAEFEPPR